MRPSFARRGGLRRVKLRIAVRPRSNGWSPAEPDGRTVLLRFGVEPGQHFRKASDDLRMLARHVVLLADVRFESEPDTEGFCATVRHGYVPSACCSAMMRSKSACLAASGL